MSLAYADWSTGLMLVDVVTRIEDALEASNLGLKMVDRVDDLARCTPDDLHDGACMVKVAQTTNTGAYRDHGQARVRDSLQVQFLERLTPGKQRASRNRHLTKAAQVRALVTGLTLDAVAQVAWVSTTRGSHPASRDKWLTTLTFTVDRDDYLGS